MDEPFSDTVPYLPRNTATEDIDDTAELPILAPQLTRDLRKYTRSFLRFYRARRVLSGNRNINTVTRERALYAWQYLETLVPADLPPTLREPYQEILALGYLLDRGDNSHSPIEFVAKILQVSTSIDAMVDNFLLDKEKPPS